MNEQKFNQDTERKEFHQAYEKAFVSGENPRWYNSGDGMIVLSNEAQLKSLLRKQIQDTTDYGAELRRQIDKANKKDKV